MASTELKQQALDLGDSVVVFEIEDSPLHDGACVPVVKDHPELADAIVKYCRGEKSSDVLETIKKYSIPKVQL